jgi:CHC2 zinc finger
MGGDIAEAKRRLPLPVLMQRLGLGAHAKKRAFCPFHDDQRTSFSIYRDDKGEWRFKCFAGCGAGDEITFLELHKRISNGEATKLFLEMAGVNGAVPLVKKPRSTSTLDWRACVESFTQEHIERLAKWRGYSIEFCHWLKENGLVGLYDGRISFPVHDRADNVVVATHYRLKDGSWRYFPQGTEVRPLVIGELVAGNPIHVFESQWDAFAFMDRTGTRNGIIITRGAGNGALVAGLGSAHTTYYAWKQNDELKNGKRAGNEWLKDVAAHAGTKVLWPKTPEQFNDLNEWTQKGRARRDDLRTAIKRAEAVSRPEKKAAPARTNSAVPMRSRQPFIILPGGDVTITKSATELFSILAPTHRVFTRGKAVVSLCRSMSGTAVLEPLRPSGARSFFEPFANFFAWRTGKKGELVLKPTIIPEETARAFLDCAAAADLLPRINGLVNCPIITEVDGSLKVCGPGFDPETGLLVQRGKMPPTVILQEAVTELRSLVSGFSFQSPSDEARAVAAFITPALKMGNLIRSPVPADVAESDQSQSGKTYRQRMSAAIYGEKPALVPLKRGGVGSPDESLFEKLVNGRPFIQFDNYRGPLDSPALEAFLTADDSFPCRIPHCREIEVDPSRFFVLITSNGIETTRDLANRSSFVRIFKRKNVQFPDTLGMVREQQSYYLGCVFAVVRAWHELGKPRTAETRHDFREWCQSLDWIVQEIFGLSPLMDGHIAAQERVSSPALTFLRRIALEVERTDKLDTALMASQIFELAEDADIQIPGLRDEDRHNDEKAKKIIGIKMASAFKEYQTIELDGFSVVRTESNRDREADNGGSYVVKTYTFSRRLH